MSNMMFFSVLGSSFMAEMLHLQYTHYIIEILLIRLQAESVKITQNVSKVAMSFLPKMLHSSHLFTLLRSGREGCWSKLGTR